MSSATLPTPPVGWTVAADVVCARRDGEGDAVLFDHATGRSWRVSDATARLLDAVRGGWAPGAPPPPALAALGAGALRPGLLDDALRTLYGQGVLAPSYAGAAEAPGAPASPNASVWADAVVSPDAPASPNASVSPNTSAPPAARAGRAARAAAPRSWRDLRLPLARVGPPPRAARAWVRRAALASPALAVAALVGTLAAGGAPAAVAHGWAWAVAGFLVLAAAHEGGHALTLAAATGRRVTVGLRLFYGFPQAYADVAAVVTLAARRDRLAVLLGGLAVEMLVWCALVLGWRATAPATPDLVRAAVVYGGVGAAVWNLVPFFRSDAYYVLQELARVDHLARAGREALACLLAAEPTDALPTPPGRWWLCWYGLLDLVLLPVLAALAAGAGVARLGLPGAGAVFAVGGGLAAVAVRAARLLRAAPAESLPSPATVRA